MNDFSTAPAGEPAGQQPTIEGLMAKLSDTSLPDYGRKPLLAQLEALHKAKADAGGGGLAQDVDDATAEALAPPASPVGYHLESHLPPGVAIENETALGSLKSGLHELGVPASIASAALGHIAELHRDGAFQSERSLHDAVIASRNQFRQVHGEAADGMLRDAAAFIDRAVEAGKITPDQADAICASSLAVSHAAMLARNGAIRR